MIRKGVISFVDTINRRARVAFRDHDSTVTAELPYADHVSPEINDMAAVAIFTGLLSDGVIIAVWEV